MKTVAMVLTGARVLNVYTGEFEQTNLWLDQGKVVSRLPHPDLIARETVELTGQYVVPGFIDAHVHVESALVAPSEIGHILLQHGVTTIVADPHELANVAGVAGIEYMIKDARQTPLDIRYMLPSSVPCVPFDNNGATLHAADLAPLYQYPEVNGLAEVMDYGAVARDDADTMAKVRDAYAHGHHADGHAAGLTAEQIEIMRAHGMDTDHESATVADVLARVDAGMYVFLREGTVERDIANTIGAVTPRNADRFAFCTDDKTIGDLMGEGSIDHNIRLAIKYGLPAELAYTMAANNAARAHRLTDRGALIPGQLADLVVVSDLDQVDISRVMKSGEWVAGADKVATESTTPLPFTATQLHHHVQSSDLRLPLVSGADVHVIGVQPNHITTDHLHAHVTPQNGEFVPDVAHDLLKMVVVERHHDTGNVGVGIVHGFGIRSGAIASSVAHDAHNIVAVGTDDQAIMNAIAAITETDGGQSVATADGVVANLPLPIGGILSDQPFAVVARQMRALRAAYDQVSGGVDFDPFITLSFLTLPVIPTLKLTDQGLFDFDQFGFIPVEQLPVGARD